jgi:hypothetical protein
MYLENFLPNQFVFFRALPFFNGDGVFEFDALGIGQPQFALGLARLRLVAEPSFAGGVQFVQHSQQLLVCFVSDLSALQSRGSSEWDLIEALCICLDGEEPLSVSKLKERTKERGETENNRDT